MIVVGFDFRAVKRPGGDLEAVGEFLHLRPDLAKLVGQGSEAIGFFVSNVSDVANRRRPFRKAGHGRQGHDAVADIAHVGL